MYMNIRYTFIAGLLLVSSVGTTILPSLSEAAAVTLNYNSVYTTKYSGRAIVAPQTFGHVYTTFLRLDQYKTSVLQAPNYAFRWPGGSLAETPSKYALTLPDIYNEPALGDIDYNVATQKGLTDMLAYANANNQPFMMVIPSVMYMSNVAQGQTDLKAFVTKLLRGDYGPVPKDITFEIGNESAHLGWANGKFTPGVGSYGNLANALLTTLRTTLADAKINPNKVDIKVLVQLSTTTGGQHSIFNQIIKDNLKSVDGFIYHDGLVNTGTDFNFLYQNEKIRIAKKYWDAAWVSNIPEFKLFSAIWNVGGADSASEVADFSKIDIGARQAPAIVKVFSQMIGTGVDSAMTWGVQDKVSSLLFHKGETITHGGQAYRLMAEVLPGMQQLAGKVDSAGNWTAYGTNFDIFAYSDATKIVLFVTAGDIPATGLDVTVTLSNFGTIKSITTESIKTLLTNPGTSSPDDDRRYEEPLISQSTLPWSGTKFTYRLTQDYETARIVIKK